MESLSLSSQGDPSAGIRRLLALCRRFFQTINAVVWLDTNLLGSANRLLVAPGSEATACCSTETQCGTYRHYKRDSQTVEEENRFHATVPILCGEAKVGHLCLADSQPRPFGEREETMLTDFAALISALLESHQREVLEEALASARLVVAVNYRLQQPLHQLVIQKDALVIEWDLAKRSNEWARFHLLSSRFLQNICCLREITDLSILATRPFLPHGPHRHLLNTQFHSRSSFLALAGRKFLTREEVWKEIRKAAGRRDRLRIQCAEGEDDEEKLILAQDNEELCLDLQTLILALDTFLAVKEHLLLASQCSEQSTSECVIDWSLLPARTNYPQEDGRAQEEGHDDKRLRLTLSWRSFPEEFTDEKKIVLDSVNHICQEILRDAMGEMASGIVARGGTVWKCVEFSLPCNNRSAGLICATSTQDEWRRSSAVVGNTATLDLFDIAASPRSECDQEVNNVKEASGRRESAAMAGVMNAQHSSVKSSREIPMLSGCMPRLKKALRCWLWRRASASPSVFPSDLP
eukprot:gene4654-5097_t